MPHTVQLQEGDTTDDLVGDVVIIVQSGSSNSTIDGTFTVSITDIVAAGASGYQYLKSLMLLLAGNIKIDNGI